MAWAVKERVDLGGMFSSVIVCVGYWNVLCGLTIEVEGAQLFDNDGRLQ